MSKMKKRKKKVNSNMNGQDAPASAEDIKKDTPQCEVTEPVNDECAQASEEQAEAPSQDEWAAALTQAVKERDSYKEALMRSQAEFINFKRRNATVRTDAYDDGARETIFAVLPIIDNLELAILHAEQQGENGAMVEGVKMTLRMFLDALAKLGLQEVAALGEKFDPEVHNAVMRAPGGEADTICEVFQKGYKVKDKMIRYAMVKVSSGEE